MNVNRRAFSWGLGSLLLGGTLAPAPVAAQNADAGSPAASTTTKTVTTFIGHLFHLYNNHDPAALDMVDGSMYPIFFNAQAGDTAGATAYLQDAQSYIPAHLYGVNDVRTIDAGNVTADVMYSGWGNTQFAYWSEKWTLERSNAGHNGYKVVNDVPVSKAADGLTVGRISTSLSLEAMKVSGTDKLPAGIGLLFDDVTNVETKQSLTSGVYLLPDGMAIQDAHQALLARNFGALTYIGPTPKRPGQHFQFKFVVEPGIYVIQAFTLDNTWKDAEVIQGDQFFTSFTIAGK